jgi:ketosteroid isomerase-like protein
MSKASGVQETVRAFVSRINAHDAAGIVALCTCDHVFVDSLGSQLSGVDQLERAWRGYFALFPDYRVEIASMVSAGGLVLACGLAAATHEPSGERWRIPAAWRAKVVGARVAEWQVYADNKPVYEIVSRSA